MNLLICGFGCKWHGEIINGLVDGLSCTETVLMSPIFHAEPNGKKFIRYDFQDIAYGCYKSISINRLQPLDACIIEKMSLCENLYLSMIDRLEVKVGKRISYNQRKENYYCDLRILNDILDRHKIDVVILDYIPHLGFDYVLYELCKQKKIRVVMQSYAMSIPYRTTSRYFLDDIFNPMPHMEQVEWNPNKYVPLSDRMEAYIDYYDRKKEEIVSYVTIDSFKKTCPKFFKYIVSTMRMIKEKDRALIPAIKLRSKQIIRTKKINSFISNKNYKKEDSDEYLYFPLHYQPECTTMPMAKLYSNQLLVIDLLCAELPPNMKLYVKPHPNTSILADENFYRKIADHDNVIILNSTDNTYDLIDRSIAVVTLTGTVGWESLVRAKPVLMFGYFFYQYAPGVFHINTVNDCRNAISIITKGEYKFNRNQLRHFLKKIDEMLIDGYIDEEYAGIYEIDHRENIKKTIDGYIKYINK